jgi:predicted nucleotidyltransferase
VTRAERLVAGLRRLLAADLVGVYLHGSEVLGGGGPHSDVDVLAVSARRVSDDERRELVELCRTVPRLEFDLVVVSEIRPWSHPAPYDFHYSALRSEGLGPGTNTDLAAVVTMALAGNQTLYGPPPADVLAAVPRADYVDAILYDTDTRDVIMLARVWAGVSTDDVHSKLRAAEWALARLPEEHRPVLEHAVAFYRGEREEPPANVGACVAYIQLQIQNAISTAST